MRTVSEAILEHALTEFPRESCGLVVVINGRERYLPITNIAESDGHFDMDPKEYANASDLGEILKIVHSHCNKPPLPTQPDLVSCEAHGKPWIIVSVPNGNFYEFEPSGYVAPLVGREFHHGVLDCYSLARDYYKRELGIIVPDFSRQEEWWLKGDNMYVEHMEEAGFVKVSMDDIQLHDGIVMQFASKVPNHGAVYIGDNLILHHVMNRLSSRDIYGGWYRKCTASVLRHKSLVK